MIPKKIIVMVIIIIIIIIVTLIIKQFWKKNMKTDEGSDKNIMIKNEYGRR
jgi:Na+-transporting methylmalonyl-CoA/oxaloacetate decarboxylase gamma subunit